MSISLAAYWTLEVQGESTRLKTHVGGRRQGYGVLAVQLL